MRFVQKKEEFYGNIVAILMIILIGSFSLSQSTINSATIFSTIFNEFYRFLPYVLIFIYCIKNRILKCGKIFNLFCLGLVMVGVVGVISLLKMIGSGIYNPNLISGLKTFLWPMLISFIGFSLMNQKQVYYMMVGLLIVSFISYILSLGGFGSITLDAIQSISFHTSYSPFESHGFAGLSATFAAYFIYYRKNKIITILSIIYALMTFKRATVIFTLFFVIVSLFSKWKDKKTNDKIVKASIIITLILTIMYTYFLNPLNISNLNSFFLKHFELDIFSFTMGRNTLFSQLLNSGFISSGIDSSWCYSKDIEMDLVKLLLEIGVIGVLIIISFYWQFAKANWYSFIYMISVFFNLLTSHSFHTISGWIVRYILLLSLIRYPSKTQPIIFNKIFKRKSTRVKSYDY